METKPKMIVKALLILTYIALILTIIGLYTNNLNLCAYAIIILLTILTFTICTITIQKIKKENGT